MSDLSDLIYSIQEFLEYNKVEVVEARKREWALNAATPKHLGAFTKKYVKKFCSDVDIQEYISATYTDILRRRLKFDPSDAESTGGFNSFMFLTNQLQEALEKRGVIVVDPNELDRLVRSKV